jgi:hypothetical protein
VPPTILGRLLKRRNPLNKVVNDDDIKLTCYQAPTVLKREAHTMLEQPDAASLTTHPGRYSFEPGLADRE